MKHGMSRRHLRFATSEAYDPLLKRGRYFVVEQSAEELALDEPITGAHGDDTTTAESLSDSAASSSRRLQHEDIAGVIANPLRGDDPHPTVIATVKRFGIVGLTACALCAAFMRWFRSLTG